MKKFINKYFSYIYNNFIKEDYSIYKKWGVPVIKILNFMHSIVVWILAIVFFPIFILGTLTNKLESFWREIEK